MKETCTKIECNRQNITALCLSDNKGLAKLKIKLLTLLYLFYLFFSIYIYHILNETRQNQAESNKTDLMAETT